MAGSTRSKAWPTTLMFISERVTAMGELSDAVSQAVVWRMPKAEAAGTSPRPKASRSSGALGIVALSVDSRAWDEGSSMNGLSRYTAKPWTRAWAVWGGASAVGGMLDGLALDSLWTVGEPALSLRVAHPLESDGSVSCFHVTPFMRSLAFPS